VRQLEIYGDGSQTRDFIFVEDLVSAIKLAATKPDVGGQKFQIATNMESTVAEVAEMISSILRDFDINDIEIDYKDLEKTLKYFHNHTGGVIN